MNYVDQHKTSWHGERRGKCPPRPKDGCRVDAIFHVCFTNTICLQIFRPHFQSDDDSYCKQSWSIRKTVQNLKITVVPDVTAAAGLDGRPFDATLSMDEYETLHSLRNNWMACAYFFCWTSFYLILFTYIYIKHYIDKQGVMLTQALKQVYYGSTEPHNLGLKLFANCNDTTSTKANSLAFSSKFFKSFLHC